MFLFVADKIDGNLAYISAEEARHATKVLRMKEGDRMLVTALDGVMHEAAIETIAKDMVTAVITESYSDWDKRDYYLRVCISPTKNIERYEWFLEKAVEIGIDRITPICTEHSERRIVKKDRSEKIICSAVKQSVKASRPQLDELTELKDFFKEKFTEEDSLYIAHCDHNDSAESRVSIKDVIKPKTRYTILIGPEGDFSDGEVSMAKSCGFTAVSFGESRLRTETAGVWAVALASIINI